MKKSDIIMLVFGVLCFFIIGIGIYQIINMPIRQTKDFATMYIDEGYVFDAQDMINPPKEFSQLLQIDQNMRTRVANYMNENNYKLKSGKQEFIRNNPTFEELIEDCFKFETIK